jgi:hypothetical protein
METFWAFGMFNPSIDPTEEGINHFNWNNLSGPFKEHLTFCDARTEFSGHSHSVDIDHKNAWK